jgi:hypothetical protein
MKLLLRFAKLSLCAFAFTLASVYGDTFSYSYTLGDGWTVNGTFQGTYDGGNLITGITNASVFIDGFSIDSGAGLTIYSYAPATYWTIGAAQVSIDGTENNFLFCRGDFYVPNSTFFWSTSAFGDGYQTGFHDFIHLGRLDADQPTITSNWKVPDSGTTIALLGGTFIGLAALRRRFVA